jgi:hypothetical protein
LKLPEGAGRRTQVDSPGFHSHSNRLVVEPGAWWDPISRGAAISLTVLTWIGLPGRQRTEGGVAVAGTGRWACVLGIEIDDPVSYAATALLACRRSG